MTTMLRISHLLSQGPGSEVLGSQATAPSDPCPLTSWTPLNTHSRDSLWTPHSSLHLPGSWTGVLGPQSQHCCPQIQRPFPSSLSSTSACASSPVISSQSVLRTVAWADDAPLTWLPASLPERRSCSGHWAPSSEAANPVHVQWAPKPRTCFLSCPGTQTCCYPRRPPRARAPWPSHSHWPRTPLSPGV